ncbi:MAG: cytochrome C oxidase subunit IV family protein [Candidatus Eiseniibacteriota bacterium]
MSEHVAHAGHGGHEPGHGGHGGHEAQHAHPTAKKYLGIAIVLTVITVIEVAVFYIPSLKPVLVPVLLSLSAVKFALVAMFYMHLKFDPPLYSWVFVVPMVFAAAIILALMALFGVLKGGGSH